MQSHTTSLEVSKDRKLIRKWFPFLNSWKLSDEPKMLKMIEQRIKEINKARFMARGLPKLKTIKPEPYPFG
jgi:hypothetical protein